MKRLRIAVLRIIAAPTSLVCNKKKVFLFYGFQTYWNDKQRWIASPQTARNDGRDVFHVICHCEERQRRRNLKIT
jgi:hypothetical protein